ncbi:MAG: phosphotransferase [Dermatophilaceae bacterium]
MPAGPGLAGHLGRVIAEIHALDRRLVDDAGGPVYDADSARTARLADLDRAAETGQVPSSLLERWEQALDDVTLWRFAPTVVHGGLTTGAVLADFADPTTAASGSVTAVLGWDETKVGDPAEDFAALVSEAHPAAVDSVIEAYANARPEGVDPHLRRRALLASEFAMVRRLLVAVSVDDPDQTRWHATRLRRLAGEVSDEDFAPEAPAVPPVKPTVVAIDDQEAARVGEADRHTQAWDTSTTQELTSPTLIARSPEAPEPPEPGEDPEPDESTEPHAESADAGEDADGSLGDGDRPEQPA